MYLIKLLIFFMIQLFKGFLHFLLLPTIVIIIHETTDLIPNESMIVLVFMALCINVLAPIYLLHCYYTIEYVKKHKCSIDDAWEMAEW